MSTAVPGATSLTTVALRTVNTLGLLLVNVTTPPDPFLTVVTETSLASIPVFLEVILNVESPLFTVKTC